MQTKRVPRRCGSCSSAEKTFITGEEIVIRGRVVCTQNDWNYVKIYYIQVRDLPSVRNACLPFPCGLGQCASSVVRTTLRA